MPSISKLPMGVMTHLPICEHVGAIIILWSHCRPPPPAPWDQATLIERLRSGTRGSLAIESIFGNIKILRASSVQAFVLMVYGCQSTKQPFFWLHRTKNA